MKSKRFYVILALIAACVITLGIIIISHWAEDIPYETASAAEFTATISDERGVDVNSAFNLAFPTKVSSASVMEALTVEPNISVGVHQGSGKNEVLVAPAEPLEEGTIYTFTLTAEDKDLSWAFQTASAPHIASVFPVDKSVGVDNGSSIDIVFDQTLDLDMANLAEYISVEPQVDGEWTQNGRVLTFDPDGYLDRGTVYAVSIKGVPIAGDGLIFDEEYSFAFETEYESMPDWHIDSEYSYAPGNAPVFTFTGDLHSVSATLYSFPDAASYASAMNDMLNSAPSWSVAYTHPNGVDVSEARRRSTYYLGASESRLSMYNSPGPGYYLLRCRNNGFSQDLMFCVTDIDSWATADSNKALLWMHDHYNWEPLVTTITDAEGNELGHTAANGATAIDLKRSCALIATDENTGSCVVVPCRLTEPENESVYSNYRYLYLDRSNYSINDTLNFWGVVKPRDGSDLQYERVSVYVYSCNLDQVVYKDYADLKDNVFSGSLIIPSMLDGEYSLQIWQSGQLLTEQYFTIGGGANTPAEAGEFAANGGSYNMGSTYTITCSDPAEDYLFFESEGSIGAYSAGTSAEYSAKFSPKNYLASYLTCICYGNGHYHDTKPYILRSTLNDRRLKLSVEGSLQEGSSGASGDIDISVIASDNLPTAASVAVSVVSCSGVPNIDTFQSVFEDVPAYYTRDASTPGEREQGKPLFFAVVESDDDGQAICHYQLPEFSGKCWLIIQAIDGVNMQTGSLVMEFGEGNGSSSGQEGDQQAPVEYESTDYELEQLTEGASLAENSILAVFGSEERMRMLSVLFDSVCGYNDSENADAAFAYAHARQLLLDYGGEQIAPVAGKPIDLSIYQKDNGGIGDLEKDADLSVSVAALAAAPENIDYLALMAYYDSFINTAAGRDQMIRALAGKALYKQAVLNDVKLLLARKDLGYAEYLWLLWAEYACGDKVPACRSFASWLEQAENSELPGEACALAAVLCALTGNGNAMEWLDKAGDGYMLERVIVARAMLPRILQDESGFDYTSEGATENAFMKDISDKLLLYASPDTSFSNIRGDVWYLDIYGK